MPPPIPDWAVDTQPPDWATENATPAWARETPKLDVSQLKLSPYEQSQLPGAARETYSQAVPPALNPDNDFVRYWSEHPLAPLTETVQGLSRAIMTPIEDAAAGGLNVMAAASSVDNPGKEFGKFTPAKPGLPVIQLPVATDQELKTLSPLARKLAVVGNAINEDVSGLTTPGNLLVLPLAAESKGLQTAFLTQMASAFPDLAQNVAAAKTPEERIAAWTHLMGNAAMTGMLAHGLTKGTAAIRPEAMEPKAAIPQGEPMDEGAEIRPDWANEPAEQSPIAPTAEAPAVPPVEPVPPNAPAPAEPTPAAEPNAIPLTDRPEAGVPLQTFERPPDILDDIETHAGGLKIPDAPDFDYVREAFKELSQSKAADLSGFKLKSLFRGAEPDDALDALHREGLWHNVQTPDDLFQRMIGAAKSRVEWAKQEKTAAKFSVPSSPLPAAEAPDWAMAEVGPNDYVGMGGATPGEFAAPKGTPTSIKNALVDAERAKRGLPPAMEPARRTFGEVWDRANAVLDQDPSAVDRLVNELRDRPRALTDTEDAMLLQQQISLQNDYNRLTGELAQAHEDAKTFPNRADAVAELKDRVAKASDDLLDLYNINKSVGTETGRGLAARKMLAYEDFSLAKMEMDKRAANGGRALNDGERAELQQLHERIATTQKAYDDYVAKTEAERAQRQAAQEINDLVDRVAKTPGYDRNVLSLADRIVGALEKEADKARTRLKEKFQRVSAGVDPTILGDLAVVGAAKIARGALDFTRWSKEMVADFGEDVVPWLNQAWKRSNDRLDEAVTRVAKGKTAIAVKRAVRKEDVTGQRASIIEGIRGQKGQPLSELGPYVRKLAENFVRSGLKDREALISAVHDVLTKEVDPSLTRRQAMDAISGYGDFKPLNPDVIKKELRDLKGQMQQVAKLEDIQGKRPLQKTGLERRVPGDEERRLIQQVNEAKRRYGVVTSDPATQLKSAMDAIKTRLRNQIKDLQFQIDTKEKIVRSKTPVQFDAEATRLKMERDQLKEKYNEIFTKPGLTDQERVQNALRTVKASIDEYERRLAAKDISTAKSKTPETPELKAQRARRDALREEYQNLVDTLDPQRQERASLSAVKTRLKQRTAELQEKLAKADFTTRPRRTITLDAEAQRLKAEMETAKQAFQRGLLTDRLKNRPWHVKAQDAFLRWRRGFLLSSPVTLAKLTSAAAQRMLITPIEEGIGGGISKVLPKLAAQAPREGGLNVGAEAKALTEGFMRGLKDSWDQVRNGQSEIELLYGRGREGAIGESDVQPKSVIDMFGQLHAALKAPVKRAEFARSFEKRTAWNMSRGVDVREPGVQTRIAIEAYKDANRSIFLQDNRVVSAYKRALTAFEQPDKTTGKPTAGGKLAATTGRLLFPIVRVPTNLVAETFQYALGSVSGLSRLAFAMRKGIENLPPDQADLIMRHLKKGSLGGAVLAAGYLMPNAVGGYYQPGQKRDKTAVPVGGIRINSVTVPSYLLHNPLLETLQLGATIRHVADAKLRKHDTAPQGVPAGLAAGALGLTEEVPFVRETMDLQKLFDPYQRRLFLGEMGKNIAVPQLVQWLARQGDKDQAGEVNTRKATSTWQQFETGVPVLRQQVPLAPLPPNPAVSRFMQSIKGGTPEMRENLRQAMLRNLATNQPPQN